MNYTALKSHSINNEANINMIFPRVKYITSRICKGIKILIFSGGHEQAGQEFIIKIDAF